MFNTKNSHAGITNYIPQKAAVYFVGAIILSLATGLILSRPVPLSFKIGGFLLSALLLWFIYNPMAAILILIFMRPLVDPFTNIHFSQNINLLGAFSILYVVFLIFLLPRRLEIKIAPSGVRFYYIFLFALLLSVLNSISITESMMFFIRFVSLLAIYLLIYNIIQVKNDALKVIKAIVYSSIIPIFIGCYQFFTGKGMLSSDFSSQRLESTFVHSNMYAFYLVTIFFSILFLYYLEKNINGSSNLPFKVGLSMLVLSQLVFTYTRGAWIGILAGLFVVSLFMKETRKWIIISAIFFIMIFLPPILHRVSDLVGPQRHHMSSWAFRLEHWYALFNNAFVHKPLLGYGLGQSAFAAEKYSRFVIIPHNDYLRVLIETGATGIISFLLFWVHSLWIVLKKAPGRHFPELNTILLSLLIALLVCSFADNLIYSISVIGYLFVLLAVGHKLNFLDSAKPQIPGECHEAV